MNMKRFSPPYLLWILIWSCLPGVSGMAQSVSSTHSQSGNGLMLWMVQSELPPAESWLSGRINAPASIRSLGFDLYHVVVPIQAEQVALAFLKDQPKVRYVGLNKTANLRINQPNDPLYNQQAFHQLIGSERAWSYSTGGLTTDGYPIVVGVLDGGFDIGHEDIVDNLWFNMGEIPGDGIDNDNNGYVDDYNGFNPRIMSGPPLVNDHGQAVWGLIGATGNNELGVSGINWEIEMMGLGPTLNETEIATGIRFVYNWRKRFNESKGAQGAYIPAINMSLGFSNQFPGTMPWFCPLIDSLNEVGILVVASTDNVFKDIEQTGDMPCLCPSPNLICVTNSTLDDEFVSNAGYSKKYVHLNAPGHQSYSTTLATSGIGYKSFSGTSAAAPMVTGAIALLASLPCSAMENQIFDDPPLVASIFKSAILDGVKKIDAFKNLTISGGRLCLWCEDNLGAFISFANICEGSANPIGDILLLPNPSDEMAWLEYRSPSLAPYDVRIQNMLGQVIWEKTIVPGVLFEINRTEIPTNQFASGVYMVSIGKGKAGPRSKLMVIH